MNAEDPTLARAEPPVAFAEDVLARIETELEGSVGSAARRSAEARMLEILRAEKFTGPLFKRLYEDKMEPMLAAYAFGVFEGWIPSRRIFKECPKFRQPIPQAAQDAALLWTREEQFEFIVGSILHGADFFLDYGLRREHWDPEKGASASTYFVGSCVVGFAKVYNEWWKHKVVTEKMLLSAAAMEDDEDHEDLLDKPDLAMGPAELVAVRDEAQRALARVPDPQVREVLWLRSLGYTQAQGAAEVGLTAKTVERRLHAHRQSLRGQVRQLEQSPDEKGRS